MTQKKNARTVGAAVAVSGLLVGSMVMQSTGAAFTARTDNPGNNWQAGQVDISDNDAGTAMFVSATDGPMDAGVSREKCITVSASENITDGTHDVRLFGTSVSGPLAGYLDLDVFVAEVAAANAVTANCVGFPAAATALLPGQGDPIDPLNGRTGPTLADFSLYTGFDNGLPVGVPAAGNVKVFKFVTKINETESMAQGTEANPAEGTGASANFVWQIKKSA